MKMAILRIPTRYNCLRNQKYYVAAVKQEEDRSEGNNGFLSEALGGFKETAIRNCNAAFPERKGWVVLQTDR